MWFTVDLPVCYLFVCFVCGCYNGLDVDAVNLNGETLMLAVKGVFEQGRARPIRMIRGREGQPVIITFLDEPIAPETVVQDEAVDAWLALSQLVDSCAVDTGITDLAHRHDSYLHHSPAES